MGSISWPVKRLNHTLVECEIPAIPATVGEATAIVLKQHTVLYKKCFLNTSAGPTEVLRGHVDESLPTRVGLYLCSSLRGERKGGVWQEGGQKKGKGMERD